MKELFNYLFKIRIYTPMELAVMAVLVLIPAGIIGATVYLIWF